MAGVGRKSGVQHSQREPLAGVVETQLIARSIQVKSPSLGRSRHCRQPGNGNARGASTPPAQHPARIVQAIRAEIGLHQRELDQVELCAAAPEAFEFTGDRFKRIDRGGEVSPFERGKGARHCRNAGAGGITTLEKAAMGAHLDGEIIARVRGVLANGAAASG
jgi:hypothetical protein